uniref:non-specific protein-tyrosine kinase n=1 Tax=Oryzias sinensis TaxID=183150 RepID=A0A8C8DJ74_9TELE
MSEKNTQQTIEPARTNAGFLIQCVAFHSFSLGLGGKRPVQLYAALFDFQARSDDELTVKEGDKLSVIEKRGEYVLAKKLTGSLGSGLIPANYVALILSSLNILYHLYHSQTEKVFLTHFFHIILTA